MKKHKQIIALSIASSVSLYGCGGGDDASTSEESTSYSVKAIDGYLQNAQVWLDLDNDFELDDAEPNALTGDGGIATLSIPASITNPEQYQLIAKAIKSQTINEDTGPVKMDYLMSAPAGQTNITPLSTLVNIKLATGLAADIETATQEVADQLGISKEQVLTDFIENGYKEAAFSSKTIVASGKLPETEQALADYAEPENEAFNTALLSLTGTLKEYFTQEDYDSSNLDSLTIDSAGAISPDKDQDGIADTDDDFPDNKLEWLDTDEDGVGDNADKFPENKLEWLDTDEDGVGDNADKFPENKLEWLDTDEDGFGDNADKFPDNKLEWLDTDEDGVGDNADKFPENKLEWLDTDEDGFGDNADKFPDNKLEWLDTDEDGVGDNADKFPENKLEWLDTDEDGFGDNSDPDIDGDGVLNEQDVDPIDPNVGVVETNAMADFISNTPNYYFVWDDTDSDDNTQIIAQKFTLNGSTTAPSETFNIMSGEWEPITEYTDIIMTEAGWAVDKNAYQMTINEQGDVVAFSSTSTIPKFKVTADVIDLSGMKVIDYLTEYFDSSLFNAESTYEEGASSAVVTLTYLYDEYELYDENLWMADEAKFSDSEDLSSLYVSQSSGQSPYWTDVRAVSIGNGLGAQFIMGGIVNYYSYDWDSVTMSLIATGTWEEKTVNDETILLFTPPDETLNYIDLDNVQTLIISGFDGGLRLGRYTPSGTSEINEDLTFNETAIQNFIDAINTPLVACTEFDATNTTQSDFSSAIANCGGQVDITEEMVTDKNFYFPKADRNYTFKNDGNVDVYYEGNYDYTDQWRIENGQLVMSWVDSATLYGNWTWAMTKRQGNEAMITSYDMQVNDEGGKTEIISFIIKEQAFIPDSDTACTIEETENATLEDFNAAISACNVPTDQLQNGDAITRISGDDNELRSYYFGSNGNAMYFRNGVPKERTYSYDANNHLVLRYEDGTVDRYMHLLSIEDEDGKIEYHTATYYPEDMTIDTSSFYDEDTELTVCIDQEESMSYSDFLSNIATYCTNSDELPDFSADFFNGNTLINPWDEDGINYKGVLTLNTDGSGEFQEYNADTNALTLEADVSWEIEDENGIKVLALTYNVNNGDVVYENSIITDTNGYEIMVHTFSNTTGSLNTGETYYGTYLHPEAVEKLAAIY